MLSFSKNFPHDYSRCANLRQKIIQRYANIASFCTEISTQSNEPSQEGETRPNRVKKNTRLREHWQMWFSKIRLRVRKNQVWSTVIRAQDVSISKTNNFNAIFSFIIDSTRPKIKGWKMSLSSPSSLPSAPSTPLNWN